MKFIADAMLGRLARWLRILGYDVLYFPDIEDRQVIRIAREEDRTILTRDNGIARRKGVKVILITSDHISEQLGQIKDGLRPEDADPFGRCAECNGILLKVTSKKEVRDSVPDFIYHDFDVFFRCTGCGKVYWKGSHQERFEESIRDILKVKP